MVYDTQIWEGGAYFSRAGRGRAHAGCRIHVENRAMTGSRIGWVIGPEDVYYHG
jgi:arginine:pyruvate transaminase